MMIEADHYQHKLVPPLPCPSSTQEQDPSTEIRQHQSIQTGQQSSSKKSLATDEMSTTTMKTSSTTLHMRTTASSASKRVPPPPPPPTYPRSSRQRQQNVNQDEQIEHMTCYPCSITDGDKPIRQPTQTEKATIPRRLSESSLQTTTTADTSRRGNISRKSVTFSPMETTHTDKNPYIVAPHLLAGAGGEDCKNEEFHHPLHLSALDSSSSSRTSSDGGGVPTKETSFSTCETFETSAAYSRDARSSLTCGSASSTVASVSSDSSKSRTSMVLDMYRSLAETGSCNKTGVINYNDGPSMNQAIGKNEELSPQKSSAPATKVVSLKAPPLVPPGPPPRPPSRLSGGLTTGSISTSSTSTNEKRVSSDNDSFVSSNRDNQEITNMASIPLTLPPLTPEPEPAELHNGSPPKLGLRSFGGALSTIKETPKPPKLQRAIPDPTCHRLDSSLAVPASLALMVVDQADEKPYTDEQSDEGSIAVTIYEVEEERKARERQDELNDLADRIKQHYAPLKTDLTRQGRRSLSPAVRLKKGELSSSLVSASSAPEASMRLQKEPQSPSARLPERLHDPSSIVAKRQLLDSENSTPVAKLNKQQRKHRSKERKPERLDGNRRVLQQRSASQSHGSHSGTTGLKMNQSNPRRCRSFDQAAQADKNNRSKVNHEAVTSSFTSRTSKSSHSSKSSKKGTRKKKKKDRQKNQPQHDDQQELQVVAANPSQDENLIVDFPQKQRKFTALVDDGHNNNYDSKGRCIHHPSVRLRKKKMFGRGWKVLLKACPDCCVDELRRIRSSSDTLLKEQNKKKDVELLINETNSAVITKNSNVDGGRSEKKSPRQRIRMSRRRDSTDTASMTQSSSSASSGSESMTSSCIPLPRASAAARSPSPMIRLSRQNSTTSNNCNSKREGRCSAAIAGDNPVHVSVASHDRSRRRNLSLQPTRSRPSMTSGDSNKQANNNKNPPARPSSMPPLSRPNNSLVTSSENNMSKKTSRTSKRTAINSHKQNGHVLQIDPPGAVISNDRSRQRNLSLQPKARSRPTKAASGNSNKQANNKNPPVRPSSMPPLSRPNSLMSKKQNKILHNNKQSGHKQNTHVLQMEYTDINRKFGYYTGAVNQDFFPHGWGQMVYYDGTELEGDWVNGCWKRFGISQASNGDQEEGARS